MKKAKYEIKVQKIKVQKNQSTKSRKNQRNAKSMNDAVQQN